jgi:hypothetical protein
MQYISKHALCAALTTMLMFATTSTALADAKFETPLGTLSANEAPGPPIAQGILGFEPLRASRCLAVHSNPTSFTTSTSWETLVARTHQFQSCPITTEFHNGDAFKIDRVTSLGQKICIRPYHPELDNRASTVWYHAKKTGWVWSGGTSRLDWNTTCK